MKIAVNIRVFLLIMLVMLSFSKAVHCQTRESCRIYFPQNTSFIVPDYLGNDESVAKLKDILSSPRIIDTLYINVTSSPEGRYSVNERISAQRADHIYNFVIENLGGTFDTDRIKVNVVPENCTGLEHAIESHYFGNDRDMILNIFRNEDLSYDQKESLIRKLNGGKTWAYFIREYMPALRYADEVVVLRTLDLPHVQRHIPKALAVYSGLKHQEFKLPALPLYSETVPAHSDSVSAFSESVPARQESDSVVSSSNADKSEQFQFGIRTNLLYDVAMVPNLGVEFHLGKRFSLGVNYAHAWWANKSAHQYWRIYGSDVVFRKYFGGKEGSSPLSGHHLGAYGQIYSYDFELGKKGQLSDLTYGGGLEYGYTLPLSGSMYLDFSLGCGYLTGEYKVYEPEDECYVWRETRQRHYIGPTRAEISFVWMFDFRRGGAR